MVANDFFVHNFGTAAMGPVAREYFRQIDAAMAATSKRTKKHREAKRQKAEAEHALCVLARMYYATDREMTETP